jgi:hypothetical protein
VLAAVIGMAVGIAAGILSPGLALDIISLWPGLVPAVLAAGVVTWKKVWRRRVGAIPQLLAFTWLSLAAAAHFAAWAPLPSGAGELGGPPATAGPVRMTVIQANTLVVRGSADELYRVGFLRRGGNAGIPTAEETTATSGLAVTVTDGGTTDWFRYQGWLLELSPLATWQLDLRGDIDADLSLLTISSLRLAGEGEVTLGRAGSEVAVAVDGDFLISMPPSFPATVTGAAQVPGSWEATGDGWRSPAAGEGWLITVEPGATLRVVEP